MTTRPPSSPPNPSPPRRWSDDWRWTLAWAGMNAVTGLLVTPPLIIVAFSADFALGMLLAVPLAGLVVGLGQMALLRVHLLAPRAWVTATIVGWLIGLFAGTLPAIWLLRQTPVLGVVALGASVGVAVGVAQQPLLRPLSERAGWWVLGHGAGSALGCAVGILVLVGLQTMLPWPLIPWLVTLAAAAGGLVYGLVTGPPLRWVLWEEFDDEIVGRA